MADRLKSRETTSSRIYTTYNVIIGYIAVSAVFVGGNELKYSPQAIPSARMNGDTTKGLGKSPTHQTSTIEYTSSAPIPPSSSIHAQNGEEDEDIPYHLYDRLPSHMLEDGKPDYLRMILMCECDTRPQLIPAKVYSAPLNLKETPLTLAVNLSARLGNEVSSHTSGVITLTPDLVEARRPASGLFIQDKRGI